MNASNWLVMCFAVCALALPGSIARANSLDVQKLAIPASDCQLADPASSSLVTQSSGAWMFRGNLTGSVLLYCPLSVYAPGGDVSNNITNFRMHYQDPDASGTSTSVTARLWRKQGVGGGVVSASPSWSSDSAVGNNLSSHRIAYHGTGTHNMVVENLYYVVVVLNRFSATVASPRFSGIDFRLPFQL